MVNKRGVINPLTGMTNGKLASTLRSALRQIWSYSVKKQYLKSVRYKLGKKFHVTCVECGLQMAIADKKRPVNKDGKLSKRKPQKLFDTDHINGIVPMTDPITGLGPYWESLMLGPLQILCKPCHAGRTSVQTKERNIGKNKKGKQ